MGVPDFDRWEDAAPLIAQVEHLHSRMCTLSLDLAEVESAGNPVVINTLLSRIAGTGLTQADIIRDLAVRLHTHVIDPEHITEVLTALDVARKAFADACGAAQSATETLRRYTQLPTSGSG